VIPLYAVERPRRRPVVTWGLIAANLVVFAWEVIYTNGLDPCLAGQLFYTFGMVPYSLQHGVLLSLQCNAGVLHPSVATPLVYLTTISSLFIHAGYLHVGGNMLFLFVFGGNIEAAFGRVKYLFSYLACGIAGDALLMATTLASGQQGVFIPAVGASGAISGVMAAYIVLYPRTPILSIVGYFLLPVRAFWFIGFWFLLQVLYQFGGIDSGVAYAAHIGGFAMGLGLAAIVRSRHRIDEPDL
jgi:rhomboid family protein